MSPRVLANNSHLLDIQGARKTIVFVKQIRVVNRDADQFFHTRTFNARGNFENSKLSKVRKTITKM